MYDAITLTNSDICVCDFFINGKQILNRDAAILEGEDILVNYVVIPRVTNYIWNKLYRREVIESVKFPVGMENKEDAPWTAEILLKAKKVCLVSSSLYHYRERNGSISHKHLSLKESYIDRYNEISKYAILIDSTQNRAVLEKSIEIFCKNVINVVMSRLVEVGDIFSLMKSVAFKNDLKIAVVVQKRPVERVIFKLLLASKDWQTMRENLQKYIAVKK